MAKYIDVDLLKEEIVGARLIRHPTLSDTRDVMSIIESQPTADVVEVKHGEWKTPVVFEQLCIARCSVCQTPIEGQGCNATAFRLINKYCPNCGAKMDGRRNT